MIDWKMLRHAYETHPEMNLRKLSDRYHVNYGTLRKHKSRYHWTRRTVTARSMATELDNSDLTGKQKLFCAYFLKSYNAVQSYRKAYQCKLSTAETNADRLLRTPKVQSELSKLRKQQVTDLHIDRSDVLRKMIQVYFSGKLSNHIYFSNKNAKGQKGLRSYPHLKDTHGTVNDLQAISFGRGQVRLQLKDMERLGEFLWQVLPQKSEPAKEDTLVRAFEIGLKKYPDKHDDKNS